MIKTKSAVLDIMQPSVMKPANSYSMLLTGTMIEN